MLKENDPIPSFVLLAEAGEINDKDFSGKYLVIYFYPKDDTTGCTLEAKDFTDNYDNFRNLNCEIVGVSKDTIVSHRKFREKYHLLHKLASDPEGQILEKFFVWQEKSMYGKKYMGIDRSTFLINPEGIIKKIWRGVKVKGHVENVLVELKALSNTQ